MMSVNAKASGASKHSGSQTSLMSPTRLLKILLAYLRPYKARGICLIITLLVEGAFVTLLALSLKFLIDYAITPRDSKVLALIIGGLAIGFLLTATSQVIRDYLYAWLGARIINDIRKEMFGHFQRLSLDFYAKSQMGDLLSRFSSDLNAIENAVVLGVPGAMLCCINIIFSACVLFVLDWRLALAAMCGLPLCLIGPKLLAPRAIKAGYTLRIQQATLSSLINENLGAQQIVKAFSLKQSILTNFVGQAGRLAQQATRFNFLSYVTERTPNIGMLLFNVLLISGGAYLAFRGSLSIGSLVSFNALFITVSTSVMGLTAVTPTLLQATGGMQRVQELLGEHPAIVEQSNARPLPPLSSGIRFVNVTFGYTNESRNLTNVSMELPKGARIAFVGHSGCGKSTNLNLIMRFYDPQAGRIMFDGIDLREALLDSLYEQVGIVFQESFLFNTSVRENIRLGKLGTSDQEVEAAARAAELHDIIVAMPEGYETKVGERGGRLSGGQRQRIAIARALIRNPALFILDEATSALDPNTEAAINETLERVSTNRTVISVTHRLKAVVNYDHIFVFHQGQLIEHGSHSNLLQRGGTYAGMWRRQSGTTVSATGQLRMTDTGILRDVPLFKDFDEIHLREISDNLITERVPAGRIIINEGDEGDRFYIIIRGQVSVSATGDDGNTHRIAILDDGDYFGEIALLTNIPTTATVETLTPSIFFILQREQLQKLMHQHPDLNAQVRAALKTRIAETDTMTA
jgi:ATP-binding cassette subfamily B protein